MSRRLLLVSTAMMHFCNKSALDVCASIVKVCTTKEINGICLLLHFSSDLILLQLMGMWEWNILGGLHSSNPFHFNVNFTPVSGLTV